jgi:hypothetical protein
MMPTSRRKQKNGDEKPKVFAIILGQCDEPMQNKVEGHQKFAQMEQDCNMAALLEVIKKNAFNIHHSKQQMYGSHWCIVTSRMTKQLSSRSWRQWVGQNRCLGTTVLMLTRVAQRLMRNGIKQEKK